jgi:hypothetical protein
MSACVTKTSIVEFLKFLRFEGNGPGFNARLGNVGYVVDKVELGQVFFPSTLVSPPNSYSTNCSIFINNPIIDSV